VTGLEKSSFLQIQFLLPIIPKRRMAAAFFYRLPLPPRATSTATSLRQVSFCV